jgi:hypothetical protein
MGARQVVVTTSRRGKDRPGWSLIDLTRKALRAVRQQFMAASSTSARGYERQMLTASAGRRFLVASRCGESSGL